MAIRTTIAEVKLIMKSCTAADATITAMIAAASGIVDTVFANDTTLTTTTLESIEQWLTAHFLASTFNRVASEEKLGDAQVTYTGKWGEGLRSTPYGQMVLLLDTTGLMANSSKQAASIYAITSFDE